MVRGSEKLHTHIHFSHAECECWKMAGTGVKHGTGVALRRWMKDASGTDTLDGRTARSDDMWKNLRWKNKGFILQDGKREAVE